MQQRRVRLGDIVDDYCPRERRITNHAVVAMIDDTVKQTRCTTCDADHEYREGKAPAPRRRKPGAADGVLVDTRPRRAPAPTEEPAVDLPHDEPDLSEPAPEPQPVELDAADAIDAIDATAVTDAQPGEEPSTDRDEWPVHRPLIRATLPRPEGQTPERKTPDFTFRPAGGRFEPHRNGQRKGGHRPMRHAQGQPSGSGSSRFGSSRTGSGSRQGAGQPGQGPQRQGNRSGSGGSGGSGGNRPGANRGGHRPGGGGRKRGR